MEHKLTGGVSGLQIFTCSAVGRASASFRRQASTNDRNSEENRSDGGEGDGSYMTCLHLILSVHKYNDFFVTACNIYTMLKRQISMDFHNSNLSSIEHPTHGWHTMCDITSKLSLWLQGNHHDIMLSFCPFHTIQKTRKINSPCPNSS